MALVRGEKEQCAAAHATHQRRRATLPEKPEQTPEQHQKPIGIREAEIVHSDRRVDLCRLFARSKSRTLAKLQSPRFQTSRARKLRDEQEELGRRIAVLR